MAITLGASLFGSPIRVHTHARVRAHTQTQMAITLGVPLMCVMHKGQHAYVNREECRACRTGLVVTVRLNRTLCLTLPASGPKTQSTKLQLTDHTPALAGSIQRLH